MAHRWANVDANFPTLDGKEDITEQLGQIQNYMWTLTEQLKYSLDNLDTTNMNQNALDEFKGEFQSQIDTTAKETALAAASIERIIESDTERDDKLSSIQSALNELSETLSGISEKLTNIGQEETTLTIGGEGITVELTGTVKVNGRVI